MQIKITYGIGFGKHEEIIEVPDGLTDDEIHGLVFEHLVSERLDFGWEEA